MSEWLVNLPNKRILHSPSGVEFQITFNRDGSRDCIVTRETTHLIKLAVDPGPDMIARATEFARLAADAWERAGGR